MDTIALVVLSFLLVILVILSGIFWIRHDNQVTERQRMRLQAELAKNSGGAVYPSTGETGEQDITSFIMEFAKNNPELVQQFLGGLKKEG